MPNVAQVHDYGIDLANLKSPFKKLTLKIYIEKV